MMDHEDMHWFAPASMLAALLAGILLATGHHIFYSSLNGTGASETVIWESISEQEANTAIGTAFAFLVKSALVFAVATAFIQVFWMKKTWNYGGASVTLKQLDSTYSALGDIFSLLRVPLWSRFPTLLVLASIAWLIPIASIITPATLSIRSAPVTPVRISSLKVPNLDFASLSFIEDVYTLDKYNYAYNGPHPAVLATTNAVMSGGDILQISPPEGNTSWSVRFFGPSLKCTNISADTKVRFLQNIDQAGKASRYDPVYSLCISFIGNSYVAWSPRHTEGRANSITHLPYLSARHNGFESFSPGKMIMGADNAIAEPSFYLMTTSPNIRADSGLCPSLEEQPARSNVSTMAQKVNRMDPGSALECRLFNSTYHVSFQYTEKSQNVTVKIPHVDSKPQDRIRYALTGPTAQLGNDWNITCPELHEYHNVNSTNIPSCRGVNRQLLQSISYQAIFDAFVRNIHGLVDFDRLQGGSKILETSLINNKALNFLTEMHGEAQLGILNLRQMVLSFKNKEMLGLVNEHKEVSDQPLAQAIEEMFQNVTVSLMSSPELQPNYSSISAPPPAQVTFHHFHNIYSYSAWKLWLAYGIAILLTTIAVLVGFATMLVSRTSYSDNFSTIFRAARGAEVSVAIHDEDLDGHDPVADYLAKAEVRFRPRRELALESRFPEGTTIKEASAGTILSGAPTPARRVCRDEHTLNSSD